MWIDRKPKMNRRNVLKGLSVLAGTGVANVEIRPVLAEPQPETTSIRILLDPAFPVLCYAPQYLAEEFLRLEGFTEIQYEEFGNSTSDAGVLVDNRVDITAGLGSDYIVAIDQGAPIKVLGGLHAGCVEVFASDRVESVRHLGGKRLLATGPGGPEHIFLASLVSHMGFDPQKDVEWVWEPSYANWTNLLKTGQVDVLNAFPPQNFALRERNIGHVILNTTIDDPWRNFFCCMVAARSDFVTRFPVSTKRAMRALVKANQLCETDPETSARVLVERGATTRYDFALKTLQQVPYGAWREFDPGDTIHFFALRLREAGLITKVPGDIFEDGTNFQFIDEIRREMKI